MHGVEALTLSIVLVKRRSCQAPSTKGVYKCEREMPILAGDNSNLLVSPA
jgi:hypothetical protein